MTEDHPLAYASFEGVIPKGQYGGGQVIVWDAGTYVPEEHGQLCASRAEAEECARRGIEAGKLSFVLQGHKLHGAWTLVRTRTGDWLFIKKEDAFADPRRDVTLEDASVLSGLTIEDLKAGRRPEPPTGAPQPPVSHPSTLPGARHGPLPASLAPMMPTRTERPFSHPDWLFEPKLDGYRLIALLNNGKARLISRRGLDATEQYPWLVRELERQPFRNAALDGEVVALDEQGRPSFQHLQNRADPASSATLLYYAFDLLALDGYDLRAVPLEQRKAQLAATLSPGQRLRLVESFAGQGEALYQAAVEHGLEGVVAKRRDSRYESGKRSSAWLKIKAVNSDEFVIGGFTRGEGARADTFGALLVGFYDDGSGKLTYAGHVGSGFPERTLRDLLAR
jgi:bifunctional non-homologous end joining protein LigD